MNMLTVSDSPNQHKPASSCWRSRWITNHQGRKHWPRLGWQGTPWTAGSTHYILYFRQAWLPGWKNCFHSLAGHLLAGRRTVDAAGGGCILQSPRIGSSGPSSGARAARPWAITSVPRFVDSLVEPQPTHERNAWATMDISPWRNSSTSPFETQSIRLRNKMSLEIGTSHAAAMQSSGSKTICICRASRSSSSLWPHSQDQGHQLSENVGWGFWFGRSQGDGRLRMIAGVMMLWVTACRPRSPVANGQHLQTSNARKSAALLAMMPTSTAGAKASVDHWELRHVPMCLKVEVLYQCAKGQTVNSDLNSDLPNSRWAKICPHLFSRV